MAGGEIDLHVGARPLHAHARARHSSDGRPHRQGEYNPIPSTDCQTSPDHTRKPTHRVCSNSRRTATTRRPLSTDQKTPLQYTHYSTHEGARHNSHYNAKGACQEIHSTPEKKKDTPSLPRNGAINYLGTNDFSPNEKTKHAKKACSYDDIRSALYTELFILCTRTWYIRYQVNYKYKYYGREPMPSSIWYVDYKHKYYGKRVHAFAPDSGQYAMTPARMRSRAMETNNGEKQGPTSSATGDSIREARFPL